MAFKSTYLQLGSLRMLTPVISVKAFDYTLKSGQQLYFNNRHKRQACT